MSVQTNKLAYQRHAYSGPRKSLKRVRGGLRKYGEESRSKIWRSKVMKKKPVKIVMDNSRMLKVYKPAAKRSDVARLAEGPVIYEMQSQPTQDIKVVTAENYEEMQEILPDDIILIIKEEIDIGEEQFS